jgi:hypothetical protein
MLTCCVQQSIRMEISAAQTANLNACSRKVEEQALELAEAIKINRYRRSYVRMLVFVVSVT